MSPTFPSTSCSPPSPMMIVPGARVNRAVLRSSPSRTALVPKVPPSVEPQASSSVASGRCSKSRRLVSRAPCDAGGAHHPDVRQFVRFVALHSVVERTHDWSTEGIADDGKHGRPEAIRCAQKGVCVEAAVLEGDDRPPAVSTGSEAKVNAVLCISGEAGRATGVSSRCASSIAASAGGADHSASTPQIIARDAKVRSQRPASRT